MTASYLCCFDCTKNRTDEVLEEALVQMPEPEAAFGSTVIEIFVH